MLSLREFDSKIVSVKTPILGSQLREHMASAMLEFKAQPSTSLPSFIASFSHPVHVDSEMLSAMDSAEIVDGGSEQHNVSVVTPSLVAPSEQSQPAPEVQPPTPECSV